MENAFNSGYHGSNLDYDTVAWFVNEVSKLKNKMAFCFKNTKIDFIMTEGDEGEIENNKLCRFCETNIESNKVTDHCQLTGSSRGPADQSRKINVTQKQSKFIPFLFHKFSNYDCHLFFKNFVNKKMMK